MLSRRSRAQPLVAHEQPTPDQRTDDNREDQRKQRRFSAHLCGDGAAKLAGQQDSAKHGGARGSGLN